MSWSITLDAPANERDLLITELWEAGTSGVTEDEEWVRAFFDDATDSDSVVKRFALYHPRFERVEEHDWVQHSQSMWQAMPLGDRFWLVPEWQEDPVPEGRMRLPMRPGLACGSGAHPATQLCVQALEKMVAPNAAVIDVGTGSGILAEAARLLGAGFVVGCDIEHDATQIAHRNVPEVAVFTGSVRSLRTKSFDLAVANLNAATIATVAKELDRVARHIILSGFHEDEQGRIEKQISRPVVERLELDGWACLIF